MENCKILWLIEQEIMMRKEGEYRKVVKGMTLKELYEYKRKLMELEEIKKERLFDMDNLKEEVN